MSASHRTPLPQSETAPGPRRSPVAAHDAGLLVIRLGIGLIIAAFGVWHLFGWWGGPGIKKTGQGFEQLGYPAPEAMAVVAGLAEALGGLGLALGLFTPLAGAAVAATMANAVVAAEWESGFFEGIAFPLAIGVTAAGLALSGPGRIAVDAVIPGLRSHRLSYGAAALILGAVAAVAILLTRD